MVTLILPGQLAEARLQFANFTENTQAGLGSGSLRSLSSGNTFLEGRRRAEKLRI